MNVECQLERSFYKGFGDPINTFGKTDTFAETDKYVSVLTTSVPGILTILNMSTTSNLEYTWNETKTGGVLLPGTGVVLDNVIGTVFFRGTAAKQYNFLFIALLSNDR